MVAIVAPVVGAAALRVLAALGVGVVAGVAGEEAAKRARKRKEEADKAKTAPIARTESTTTEKEKCKKCPPDSGYLKDVNWHMNQVSRDYQAKITGFPSNKEWHYEKDFDGFQSKLCNLQEAKADYDQFLSKEGTLNYLFQLRLFVDMEGQALAQSIVVAESKPATLTYYFQTPKAWEYMQPKLSPLGIIVLLVP